MAPRKTERILNLTICLLVSGRYLSRSQIRSAVEGYHDLSDAAFEPINEHVCELTNRISSTSSRTCSRAY